MAQTQPCNIAFKMQLLLVLHVAYTKEVVTYACTSLTNYYFTHQLHSQAAQASAVDTSRPHMSNVIKFPVANINRKTLNIHRQRQLRQLN